MRRRFGSAWGFLGGACAREGGAARRRGRGSHAARWRSGRDGSAGASGVAGGSTRTWRRRSVQRSDCPVGRWEWHEEPGARCRDGSQRLLFQTQRGLAGPVLFLEGGGACFTPELCRSFNAANVRERHARASVQRGSENPLAMRKEITSSRCSLLRGIFDTNNPENPVRDWNRGSFRIARGDAHSARGTDAGGSGDDRARFSSSSDIRTCRSSSRASSPPSPARVRGSRGGRARADTGPGVASTQSRSVLKVGSARVTVLMDLCRHLWRRVSAPCFQRQCGSSGSGRGAAVARRLSGVSPRGRRRTARDDLFRGSQTPELANRNPTATPRLGHALVLLAGRNSCMRPFPLFVQAGEFRVRPQGPAFQVKTSKVALPSHYSSRGERAAAGTRRMISASMVPFDRFT